MKKYRINWKSNKTGATGHGEFIFSSREAAQDVADHLNRQHRDIQLYHWVEVETAPDEQENAHVPHNIDGADYKRGT